MQCQQILEIETNSTKKKPTILYLILNRSLIDKATCLIKSCSFVRLATIAFYI